MRLIALALASAAAFVSVPAAAKEVYHPFVKDQFYLARGGTPATFEQVAANPLAVFRSKVAYDAFRAHVSGILGEDLDDSSFRELLRSNRVRLVPCVGTNDTAGVTDSGRFGRRVRACYRKEMNIEVQLKDGRWQKAGSQACWNAVYGELPQPLSAPVVQMVPRTVYVQSPQRHTIVTETPGIFVSGTVITVGCACCGQQTVVGTPSVFIPGSVSVTTTFNF
jgi:hypothetical protein